MNPEEMQRTLENLGLSKYQANAYITVLQIGSATATEIASASDVPKSRIYDVLRDLDDRGFVETYEQDSLRVRGVNPDTVLEMLRDQAELFETTAEHIEEMWQAPSVGDHRATLVQREETVLERAKQAIQESSGEIQISLTPAQFKEFRPFLYEAHGRGIAIKISLHTHSTENSLSVDDLEFEGAASEIRHRELPAPFVALIDRQETYFSSQDDVNQLGMLVDNYTLTYIFHWYFQLSLWEVWDEIYVATDDSPPYRYVNVRECVRDLKLLMQEADQPIRASVKGRDTTSNQPVELKGNIVDIEYTNKSSDDTQRPSLAEVAGRASIYLDKGDEIVTIGDWGAIEEDIEGQEIRLKIPSGDLSPS